MVVLIGVAVLAAMVFKKQIKKLIDDLFLEIGKKGAGAVKDEMK